MAYCLRPLSYCVRDDCAGVQMSAHAWGEVCTTTRTQMRPMAEKISVEVFLAETRFACDALRDRVIMAVSEEKNTLLHAEITCSLAVEMEDLVTAERKGVLSRNGLTASRAVRYSQ